MVRTIQLECSQFSEGAYWVYGAEYFAVDADVDYPAELDVLSDDELETLASEGDPRVRWAS